MAPDGAVTSVAGRERVQLDIPAGQGRPARRVRAQSIDATGEAGKGMTAARFADRVEYREDDWILGQGPILDQAAEDPILMLQGGTVLSSGNG